MKKNKVLFSAFVLILLLVAGGCTVNRPGTQTRIGQRTPNNNIGLRMNDNFNMRGTDNFGLRDDFGLRRNDNIGLTRNDNMGMRRDASRLGIDQRNNTDLGGLNGGDLNNTTNFNRANPNQLGMSNMSNRANAIAQKVANLNEVNRASVLLSGNTAIVGVNMKSNVQGNLTTALKRKIENTVKSTDQQITKVNVTANPDLFTRISNMANDIRKGTPISGFANEFQEIIRRINPTRQM